MKLSLYLQSPNPKLPVRVISNGYETSNVPLGAIATVVKMENCSYHIVWDHLPNQSENFNAFGGMAMTLNVLFTARISHFYGKTPPVPEARLEGEDSYYVDIEDIRAFAEKHGNIILSPPGKKPCKDQWFIWVTDHGKFKRR